MSEPGAIEPAAAAGTAVGSASEAAPALTTTVKEDARLLARALGGDAVAVRELLDRLLPVVQTRVGLALMRRQGQARGRNVRAEVEDLSQEVFLALFERDGRVLRGWQPERGLSLKGFVGLVAEREAGCILRTGKRSPFTEEPTADDTLALLRSARPAGPAAEAENRSSRATCWRRWWTGCASG